MAAHSQENRILHLLHAAYPEWTPAPILARVSLQYCRAIHSLRKKGWQIANRIEVCDGVKRGYYRLATPGTFPNKPKPASSAGFKDISRHDTSAPEAGATARPVPRILTIGQVATKIEAAAGTIRFLFITMSHQKAVRTQGSA